MSDCLTQLQTLPVWHPGPSTAVYHHHPARLVPPAATTTTTPPTYLEAHGAPKTFFKKKKRKFFTQYFQFSDQNRKYYKAVLWRRQHLGTLCLPGNGRTASSFAGSDQEWSTPEFCLQQQLIKWVLKLTKCPSLISSLLLISEVQCSATVYQDSIYICNFKNISKADIYSCLVLKYVLFLKG